MRAARFALPWWTVFVLAGLFAPAAVVHERVFGNGAGLIAASSGIVVGLALAFAATWWRWDLFTTVTATVAAYLSLGGVAALRETTLGGVLPTFRTLQTLVLQAVMSWKDLLTLAPPASFYTGPAVLPWLSGLLCALGAGLFTLRAGRYLAGTACLGAFALVGVAWGPANSPSAPLWVIGWALAVLAWWAWAARRRRLRIGSEILIGRRAVGGLVTDSAGPVTTGRRVAASHAGRQVIAGALTLALAGGVTLPALAASGAFGSRTVLRDLVEPPLDLHDYPSPLAAFRHYTTDLERTTLVTVSSLPEGARVRLAVMDTYDGIAFGMSSPVEGVEGRYVRAGTKLREFPWAGEGRSADIQLTTHGLVGPWLPTIGITDTLTFAGDNAAALQAGLHVNRWADVALTTGDLSKPASYQTHTVVPPVWSDGQLAGVGTGQLGGTPDSNVPDAVATLAQDVTAKELTQLGRARAIERYLRKGAFSNEGTATSLAGHRADRIARMLEAPELVGDDEQYATLMALMLHSLGMPARVVMGLYPEGKYPEGPIDLLGYDMHGWVEVEFSGVGWATFDPTPNRQQKPQSNVTKPRSVPRPQVLQPPAPPEPPVELPPSVTERPSGDAPEEPLQVPWPLVGAGAGGLLVLGAPIAVILLAKRRRTNRRRRADEPATAVAGAWDEVVDLATDAGASVPAALTRQETAQLLGPLWRDGAGLGAAPSTPLWYVTGEQVPRVLVLARRADAACFGAGAPEPAEVAAAWDDAGELRSGLAAGAGLFTRIRRRLSLRSLRRQARLARARRRVRR